jgi:hypothetical protein
MGGIHAYSTTPASNTSHASMAVSDSTVPNTLDNLHRELMADVKKFAADTGGASVSAGTDTVTLTTASTVTAYYDGLRLTFIAGGTNTGATTLNVDSVGAKAIRKGADAALVAGDITAGQVVDVVYDASANGASGAFIMTSPGNAFQPLDADLTTLATAFTTASASGAASLKFAEDTDNGSNAVTLQGPASTADITITLPSSAGTIALIDVENQAITGGGTITAKDLGTVSSGTTTLDLGDRPIQKYTNGGAHTLAPGTTHGAALIDITNNGSAGAITTSGWTKVVGAFTTTNGHKFRCHASVADLGSLLSIQPLQ